MYSFRNKAIVLFLAIALILALIPLGSVQAVNKVVELAQLQPEVWVDLNVDEDATHFKTIQAAVDAVTPEGVIRINGGTHTPSVPITINKALTILGIGSDTESPLINGRIVLVSQGTTTGLIKLTNLRFGSADGAITIGDVADASFDHVELNSLTFGTTAVVDSKAIQTASSVQIKDLKIINCTIFAATGVDLAGDFETVAINDNIFNLIENAGSFSAVTITQDTKVADSTFSAGSISVLRNQINIPNALSSSYAAAILNQATFDMTSSADGKPLTYSGNTLVSGTTTNYDQSLFIKDQIATFVPVLPVKIERTGVTYATIQAAIDAASNNDIITVAAGNYPEILTINKPLTLLGPNAAKAGSASDRDLEAIITYPTTTTVDTDLVTVKADGVTISGFMLDGKDLATTLWGEGVYAEASNQVVQNNIVKNFMQIGIRAGAAAFAGPYHTGALIDGNLLFSDVDGRSFNYSGVYLQGTTGTVSNNVIKNASRGLQIQPYKNTGMGTVTGNVFEAYRTGLYFNYSENVDADWAFNNNQITAITAPAGAMFPPTSWEAMLVETFKSGEVTFTGNTVNASGSQLATKYNYREINLGAGTTDPNVAANNTFPTNVRIERSGTLLPDMFVTIQAAINAASAEDKIIVALGTYDEDVLVNKSLSLIGAGAANTTISGVIGGDGATVRIGASNVMIDGFAITRMGNNPTDWNNSGLNSAGIAIQGTTITGTTIQNNTIFGNRTGIDINNSNNHTITENKINDNRTGLIFRNQTDNLVVENNEIKNNWTVGVLFLDASGGTNVPVQSALNSSFSFNDISGNWYGQVVERQTGGSLPLPGTTNLKNFVKNWWGTANPVVSTANSTEPGYSDLIPVAYGGTSTPPTGQPDILGIASANIMYAPWCLDTTCLTFGYPPVHNVTKDTYHFTIQAAINASNSGDEIRLAAGRYEENVTTTTAMNKSVNLIGAVDASGNAASILYGKLELNNSLMNENNLIENIRFEQLPSSVPYPTGKTVHDSLYLIQINGITIRNCDFVGAGLDVTGRAIEMDGGSNGTDDVVVEGCTFTGGYNIGIDRAVKDLTVRNSVFDGVRSGINAQSGETNLVVENSTFKITAQTAENNAFGIRIGTLASPASAKQMTITGSTFEIDKNGLIPNAGVYHEAIVVRFADGLASQVHNNSITGGGIVNLKTEYTVDATGNWWGSASGPIAGQTVGNVLYCGWLNAAPPDGEPVAKPVINITTSESYCTIQAAIDDATAGDKITVAAGTYAENLVVHTSVELAGVDKASVLLYPAKSGTSCSTGGSLCSESSDVIRVEANNVKIHGFTVDGDNPALTNTDTSATVNGKNIDARNGIVTNHTNGVQYTGFEVYDNNVQNIFLRGIYNSVSGTFNIHDNTVTNVAGGPSSIAIFAYFGNGEIRNNTVSLANDAISANYSAGIKFIGNQISQSSSGIHTDNAGESTTSVADLIQGNTISNCAADGYGIFTFLPYKAPTVKENTITNCAVGLSSWGSNVADPVIFEKNIVTGDGSDGSVGLYVTTSGIYWGYYDISVQAKENVISGFATGVELTADEQADNTTYEAKTAKLSLFNNNLAANTTAIVHGTQGTLEANASGNWWGTADPTAVKSLAGTNVDFTPWLASGTDTDATALGFQGDFSTLHVDDDSPQLGTINRIQEAINLVSGSTVYVEPGTYVGSVLVNKPLTLQSTAGAATTIIDGGATAANPAAGLYVVQIRASDVVIDGFTVTNPLFNSTWQSDPAGIGVGNYGDNGLSNIRVTNNVITKTTDPNWIVNYSAPHGIVVNGVVAGLEIDHNVVHDLASVVPSSSYGGTTGIALYGYGTSPLSTNVSIHDNEVYDIRVVNTGTGVAVPRGIRIGYGSGDATVSTNFVHDLAGIGIQVPSNNNGIVTISKNIVTKTNTAVLMANPLGGSIEENELVANQTGVQIDGAATAEVHYNRIFGNTTRGLTNNSSANISATNNWWGCNEGPNSLNGCDRTLDSGGYITHTPFLKLTTSYDKTTLNPGETLSVGASLLVNSADATPSTTQNVPNTTPVSFTSTTGTVNPTNTTTAAGLASSTFTAASTTATDNLCVVVDNETVCQIVTILPALKPGSMGYQNSGLSGVLGVSAGFHLERATLTGAKSLVVELYGIVGGTEQLMQTNTAILTGGKFDGLMNFSTPFDIFGSFDYALDGYWTNVRASGEFGQSVPPSKAVATLKLADDSILTATDTGLTNDRSLIIKGSMVPQDYGYVANPDLNLRGLTAGFGIVDNNLKGAQSIVVKLYAPTLADPELGQLLQTNTAIAGTALFTEGWTQFSTPFDVFGSFNYATDGYWTNVKAAEYGQTLAPSCVVAEVTLFNGSPVTAKNCTLTGHRGMIINTLDAEIASASSYVYDPVYTVKGDVAFEDTSNTYTLTYTTPEFLAGEAMNDLARYLGALYRQESSTVTSIKYLGVDYSWDTTGPLLGSNWEDSSGKTLVSTVVDNVASYNPATGIVMTLTDGYNTETVTFKFIVLDTLDAEIASAPSYAYPDGYTYVGSRVFTDSTNTYALTYTAPQFMAKAALYDLARYLGALYRQADATVIAIDYKGVTYTWDTAGSLLGSNWEDSAGTTLVSVITAEALGTTPPSIYTMTVKDGLHTNTVTFSFTVTNTLDAEIASAPSYVYTDGYTYVGEQAFVDSTNTYTLTYTAPEFLAKNAMFDLARYLGALHRQAGATVLTIKYAGMTYTWNPAGTLAGSNWEDGTGKTLVSAVVDGIASYDPATGLVMNVSDGLHTETVTFKFIITNTLEPKITSAVTYAYSPVYDYVGDVVFDDPNNIFTATYSPAEFLAEGAMNDLARYLGALYRQAGSTVISIKFNSVTYTWDETGTLKGSNWEDASGNTLVSAMVNKYLFAPADLMITVSDGIHDANVTFKLVITNTLDAEIASAPSYAYPDGYTYVGARVFTDETNTYALTYTAPQFLAKGAMFDLARYLGALYRQADATVIAIDYKGVPYTWNAAGTLLGSNWEDATGNTLVSVVTAEALDTTPPSSYTMTVKDGIHTNTVTFTFTVTNTLDAEIASAPSYVYDPVYTYVGTSAFDDATNTYTLTYNDTAFNPGAMNDLARYLGALYRQASSTVISIRFNDVVYTWNAAGTLKGSNWEDGTGKTLVSAVVDGIATYNPATGLKFTVSDGLHTETVTFKFVITDTTAPTISAMVAKGATGFADVTATDTTFTVDQGYTAATIEITMSEPVTVVAGTKVTLNDVPYGLVTVSTDGLTLTVTPYPGNEIASGIGSFTFVIPANSIKDGAGIALATLEATLKVNNVLPVVKDDSYSTNEDTALPVLVADGVLANDTDYSSLTAVLGTGPTKGSLTLNADGSFTYTPTAEFNGTDSFTYKANDGTANSAEAAVTITVNAVNDAPVADDQNLTTDEDVALNGSVTANDVDLDQLTFSKATDPASGTVTVGADGSFTYTPTANFNGSDSFTFTVSDGTLSDTGTINITVSPVNDGPVAKGQAVTTAEDTPVTITPEATDIDLDTLSFSIKTGPTHGTAEVSAGVIIYKPDLNYHGEDRFTFVANDGTVDSAEATVTITITDVKDNPLAVDDSYLTIKDTPLDMSAAYGVLANDSDVDLNQRVVSLITDVTKGVLTLNEDGSFVYTPNAGICGVDTFTYRLVTYPATLAAADGWTDEALVTITINCPPVVNPIPAQNATVSEPLTFTVVATDPDLPAPTLAFSLEGAPVGAAINPSTGVFTWTPTTDQADRDFTFKVCVSDGATTTCQDVTVSVAAAVVPTDKYKLYLPIIAK